MKADTIQLKRNHLRDQLKNKMYIYTSDSLESTCYNPKSTTNRKQKSQDNFYFHSPKANNNSVLLTTQTENEIQRHLQSEEDQTKISTFRSRRTNFSNYQSMVKENRTSNSSRRPFKIIRIQEKSQIRQRLQQFKIDYVNNPQQNNTLQSNIIQNLDSLITSLEENDFKQITIIFCSLLEICQLNKDLQSFYRLVILFGEIALFMGLHSQATFLFCQGNIIADYTKNYKLKIKCLIKIAAQARIYKKYDISIRFLYKALVYSLGLKDIKREYKVYDHLGISYYYLGKVKNALQLHEKSTQGEKQPNNWLRLISINYNFLQIYAYEQNFQYFCKGLSFVLLKHLRLPIRNLLAVQNKNIIIFFFLSDGLSEISYQQQKSLINCQGEDLINQLANSIEFNQNQFQIDNFEQILFGNKSYCLDQLSKRQQLVQRIQRQQVQDRQWSLVDSQQRVQEQIRRRNQSFGQLSVRILLSHLKGRNESMSQPQILHNISNIFKKLCQSRN